MRQPQAFAVVHLPRNAVAAAAYQVGRQFSSARPEINSWSLQYCEGGLNLGELPESERDTVVSRAIAIARQAAIDHLGKRGRANALNITMLCIDQPDVASEPFEKVPVRDKPGYVRALERLRETGARIGAYLVLDGKPTLLVPGGNHNEAP